ncbi:alpha/beta fold hydrolase [Compostibacter hankyongensis]|uniref:Alpha/beta hydrolase n=1 Tax=Compostibacter hankyongensis TaxID=1007089 RepID=A0ABP8FCK9_9BACT
MKPVHTGYATVNGLKMYYEIHGNEDGTPLVLIHGGGSTIPSNWGTLLPLLAGHHKVIAMELQAHGRSGDRDAPESFEQDADDVATLLKDLKTDKADLIGFSNGGTTALQLAIRHPERVRKIVVISANYKREGLIPGFFEGLQQATLKDMPQPLQEAYLEVHPDTGGLRIMFEKDRQRMLQFKDMADDQLRAIQAPALVMGADRDVVRPEYILKMGRLIPHAHAVILPGTHGAFIGEVCTAEKGSPLPGIAVALIEDFLGK